MTRLRERNFGSFGPSFYSTLIAIAATVSEWGLEPHLASSLRYSSSSSSLSSKFCNGLSVAMNLRNQEEHQPPFELQEARLLQICSPIGRSKSTPSGSSRRVPKAQPCLALPTLMMMSSHRFRIRILAPLSPLEASGCSLSFLFLGGKTHRQSKTFA